MRIKLILTDTEIKNASYKKLRKYLNDKTVSGFSTFELYLRIKKIRKEFSW